MRLGWFATLSAALLLGCGDKRGGDLADPPPYLVGGTVYVDGTTRIGVEVYRGDSATAYAVTDSAGTYEVAKFTDPAADRLRFRCGGCRDTTVIVGQRGMRVGTREWRLDVHMELK